jgi:hypothetical protein
MFTCEESGREIIEKLQTSSSPWLSRYLAYRNSNSKQYHKTMARMFSISQVKDIFSFLLREKDYRSLGTSSHTKRRIFCKGNEDKHLCLKSLSLRIAEKEE